MTKVRVKICGITNRSDALRAVESGADALGFLFYPASPRYLAPERAREIIRRLPPLLTTVGVFVNETAPNVTAVREFCGLDAVQLHGEETPEFCRSLPGKVIRAFRLRDRAAITAARAWETDAWLFDSYVPNRPGGTGARFNWDWLKQASPLPRPFLVAGGLTPQNVGECIRAVRPYAVDVSSGVEDEPGKKNPEKLIRLIAAVRAVPDDA